MRSLNVMSCLLFILYIALVLLPSPGQTLSDVYGNKIFNLGNLKAIDSHLKVKTGQKAPDFSLKAISGKHITLSNYQGRKNVLLTFIPAAWTPICSDQWPGYNIAKSIFDQHDTVVFGISTDNTPTLFAWTREMGHLWFEVLSDFWPHGHVADAYGVLRKDGMAERALFLIDKKGILRFIYVGDINTRPDLGDIVRAMEALKE